MIFHYLIKSIKKVSTGHAINKIRKTASRVSIAVYITRSNKISAVFIKIPINMEKTTNPGLYSFFRGLKNVLIIKGSDNI